MLRFRTLALAAVCFSAAPSHVRAQTKDTAKTAEPGKDKKKVKKEKTPVDTTLGAPIPVPKVPKLSPLFETETPLAVTFTTNMKQLKRDRGEKAPYHPATFTYADSAGAKVVVPVKARTRGIWRLKNCDFPPVRIKVSDKEAKGTLFHSIGEPKLVNICHSTETYEQYILQEFMLYRVYQVLTPVSSHVRLLKVAYADSATGKVENTRYGFFSEDPDQVAARNGGTVVKQKGATAQDLDPKQSAIAFIFQYMIGNTDFSFGGLHNSNLIRTSTGDILPVAYDFDYAGAVNTSYAVPDPRLRIRSVRDRQFRGYCEFKDDYIKALDLFKAKKDAIYALYTDPVGQLLSPRSVKDAISYFDDFYKQIQTPKQAQREIFDECVKTN
jgi:hypothetical protein